MKILLTPMASIAETSGPFSRSKELALALIKKGHEVSFCAAEDTNYTAIDNVKNYPAPIPSPMGVPKIIGKRMFKIAQITGIQNRRSVQSFEEVLYIIGATDHKFFPKDVDCILKAIADFKPDILYAEFRIAGIVAAKLAGIKVITGYSYPVQTKYASNPEFSTGVRKYLKQCGLSVIKSTLEIFDWADWKIVPSSYRLEPVTEHNTVFTGPFSFTPNILPAWNGSKNNIVVYMGNGTIPPKKMLNVLCDCFRQTSYNVYIASKQLKPTDDINIHIRDRFDFSKLMSDSAVFINHGGQNSIMTGLIYGTPQIVCPGKVFERIYNADSIVKLNSGIKLDDSDFNVTNLKNAVETLSNQEASYKAAFEAGRDLIALGGCSKVIEIMSEMLL